MASMWPAVGSDASRGPRNLYSPSTHRAVWIFSLPAGWGRVPPSASSALPHAVR